MPDFYLTSVIISFLDVTTALMAMRAFYGTGHVNMDFTFRRDLNFINLNPFNVQGNSDILGYETPRSASVIDPCMSLL